MATELITHTLCDRHLQDKDERVPATQYTSTSGMLVDLCDDCAGPLAAAEAVFQAYGSQGRRARAPRKQAQAGDPGAITCPDCGKTYNTRNSLGAHARNVHGKTVAAMLGEPTPHKCTVKGCGKTFSTPQALGLHARSHPDAKSGAK
jgi:hypothetical protein